jgi:hypothetical protein
MKNLKKIGLFIAPFVAGLGLIAIPASAQYVGPEAGQKVVFIGDSIMAYALQSPPVLLGSPGYPKFIASALEQQDKKIAVGPGADMYNSSDALLKKLSADPNNAKNQSLAPINDFLRVMAAEKHLTLVDIYADMLASLTETKAKYPKLKGDLLTEDGVPWNGSVDGIFLNCLGNELVATSVLKAFGFTGAQLAQATESWQSQGTQLVVVNSAITVRQYLQLRSNAGEKGLNNQEIASMMLPQALAKKVKDRLSAIQPSAPDKP